MRLPAERAPTRLYLARSPAFLRIAQPATARALARGAWAVHVIRRAFFTCFATFFRKRLPRAVGLALPRLKIANFGRATTRGATTLVFFEAVKIPADSNVSALSRTSTATPGTERATSFRAALFSGTRT